MNKRGKDFSLIFQQQQQQRARKETAADAIQMTRAIAEEKT